MKKTAEIQQEFVNAKEEELQNLYEEYALDSRVSVQKIITQYRKKEAALQKEKERVENMCIFEKRYSTYNYICGVDEVGRGPLAGPVVAGAVILPKNCRILYLNDSKKLSSKRRDELYDEICEKAISYGIGMASPQRIDEINILQATYEAMKIAISSLQQEPDLLLNDAVTIPDLWIQQIPIIKGDEKSLSIAAASVIAKVTRDRIMMSYDSEYPQYGFAGHKGYGSEKHMEAIKQCGITPIHRRSFLKKYI